MNYYKSEYNKFKIFDRRDLSIREIIVSFTVDHLVQNLEEIEYEIMFQLRLIQEYFLIRFLEIIKIVMIFDLILTLSS